MKRIVLLLALVAALLSPVATAEAQGDEDLPLLSISGVSVTEDQGTMPFTLTLNRPSDEDVVVRVQPKTVRNQAKPGEDFVRVRRNVVIPAGETTATFEVTILNDDVPEEDAVIRLVIRRIKGATFVKPPRPRALIIDDDGEPEPPLPPEPPTAETDFELKVLHINDHHSHLESDGTDLDFNGKETRVEMGGFSRVITKMNELRDTSDIPVVTVHAGDAITGTLYYSLFKGDADAAMMNHVCFDIFELGNHEFDDGDGQLAVFLNNIGGIYNPASAACRTTILGANVKPAQGTPLFPTDEAELFIKPFTVKEYGDDKVGFVGLDIANKTRNSSSPLKTTEFLDEVETAQKYVDQLTADGIDKIVLVTHIQYANDLSVASQVEGVDAIVGGDSHSLLGDFGDFGLNPVGEYPTVTQDPAGNTVCVVQAWEYSNIVGELNIGWDADGNVTTCGGTPHLLLGDTFEREPEGADDREPLAGDDLQEVLDIIDASPQLSIVTPDADGEATLGYFTGQVDELVNTEIGTVTEDLCLERIPGEARSTICDVADTADMGGDIQQLVTHAFWQRSFESDIAIQNAGGVRVDIPAGPLTIADVYELLPFANTLVNLEMTGAEVKAVLEDAAENAIIPDGSTGAYPYASGLRWDVDLTAEFGSRFSNLQVKGKDATEWTPLDEAATYTIVTNSFVAAGRDGYTTFGTVFDEGRVEDTFIDYAQAFIDYVEQNLGGVVSKVPADEYSTQNVTQ